ncbi:MAG: amino acid ABC transporter substrate-binding protein [Candidatus Binataceae bacterium]
MTKTLTIGLSLSLTGEYAAMGRPAEAALALFVADTNMAGGLQVGGERYELVLDCRDDGSRVNRAAEIYRELCFEHRADLILGPYSSALTRAAAPLAEEARMVFVNHGGADDSLYDRRARMIVGVLSPASDYMLGFVRLLATLKLWRKRLAIVASRGPFARAVAAGIERACKARPARRRGVRVRLKYNGGFDGTRTPGVLLPGLRRTRVNALISAGGYAHDTAVMRLVVESNFNIPVLGCVAAGVDRFTLDLGENAEGIVGPSQWEEQAQIMPEFGPAPAEFARRIRTAARLAACDYPAAQAYAAGLVTLAAVRAAGTLEQERIRAAFADLRTTTFFGDFAIDRVSGRQVGHKMLLVQWHRGRKVIIEPEAHTDQGELELPAGWRLIAAGFQYFKLSRRDRLEHYGGEDGSRDDVPDDEDSD